MAQDSGQMMYARRDIDALHFFFFRFRTLFCKFRLTPVQDDFNASVDRENEMKCISSRQLCSLTSSSIVSFSDMLTAILASSSRKS